MIIKLIYTDKEHYRNDFQKFEHLSGLLTYENETSYEIIIDNGSPDYLDTLVDALLSIDLEKVQTDIPIEPLAKKLIRLNTLLTLKEPLDE